MTNTLNRLNKLGRASRIGGYFSEIRHFKLHIPLSEETTYLFNDDYLDNFKKPIYLVNTSRGKCVVTKTILKGLKKKRYMVHV